MNTRTLAALAILFSVSGAASAQVAFDQLRSAAGPAAVIDSIKINGVTIGIKIEEPRREDDRGRREEDRGRREEDRGRREEDRRRDDGVAEAIQACANEHLPEGRRDCLAEANRGRFFERDAVKVCARMQFRNNTGICLRAIADKTYLPAETSACGGEAFDHATITCLEASGRPAARNPDPRDGRDQAAEVCGKASFADDRRDCLQAVSRAEFFDLGAVSACSTLDFSPSYPKCFAAIADKDFLPAAAAACGKESFDDDKISCLSGSGQEPRRRGRR